MSYLFFISWKMFFGINILKNGIRTLLIGGFAILVGVGASLDHAGRGVECNAADGSEERCE